VRVQLTYAPTLSTAIRIVVSVKWWPMEATLAGVLPMLLGTSASIMQPLFAATILCANDGVCQLSGAHCLCPDGFSGE
jgi:hypothetical protein